MLAACPNQFLRGQKPAGGQREGTHNREKKKKHGSYQKWRVPADVGDNEQIQSHRRGLEVRRYRLNHNRQGYANPHLTDDVGRNQTQKCPRGF